MGKTVSIINQANQLLAQDTTELVRLKMPIGVSDFSAIIRNNCCFIDKTLFIKEILDSGGGVTLITRPRRWGKTLGLSMLECFLAMEVDADGQELAQNSNRPLFNNLKIEATNSINEQGKHPVIFICLKDTKADTYEETEASFRAIISDVFKQYQYIATSINNKVIKLASDEDDLRLFKAIINRDSSITDLKSSLKELTRLIEAHHKKKTYLLIDEYDAPLNNAYNTKHYEQTLSLIKALFSSTLKGNDHMQKAVITGVFKIAKSGLFSGLNNCKDYSILAEQYAQYFGFTECEVEFLLTQANIHNQTIISAVRQWYNGYHIGKFTIYNPWSIINFFSDLKIGPYWVNTESMVTGERRLSTDIMITDEIHDKVNLLITNFGKELTEITINPEVVFAILQQKAESLWGLLLFGGYLSVESSSYDQDGSLICQAKIPNEEVLSIYNSSIYSWVKDKLTLDKTSFDSLGRDFNLEDVNNVKQTIDNALEIYGNRIAQQNESIFHGLIQSICLLKGDKHRLVSESYTGKGRADSIFYPVEGKSDTVIIHEYKIIKDLKTIEELKASLEDAIWQIYDKIYSSEVLFKNIFHNLGLKYIEVRAIVIVCDNVFNKISTQIVVQKHLIEEMQNIVHAFTSDSSDEDTKIIDQVADEVVTEVGKLLEKYAKREQKRTRKLTKK